MITTTRDSPLLTFRDGDAKTATGFTAMENRACNHASIVSKNHEIYYRPPPCSSNVIDGARLKLKQHPPRPVYPAWLLIERKH